MNNKRNSTKNNSSLSDKNTSETQAKLQASDSLTTNNYKSDSYWSNVLYGIGMLAFIMIPVVIPGMTAEVTAIGLYSIIIGIYVAALLYYVVRIKKSTGHRKRGRKR